MGVSEGCIGVYGNSTAMPGSGRHILKAPSTPLAPRFKGQSLPKHEFSHPRQAEPKGSLRSQLPSTQLGLRPLPRARPQWGDSLCLAPWPPSGVVWCCG